MVPVACALSERIAKGFEGLLALHGVSYSIAACPCGGSLVLRSPLVSTAFSAWELVK